MRISSRVIIKEAVDKSSFLESIKQKYGNDSDFMVPDPNGVLILNNDVIPLVSRYFNTKGLSRLDKLSDEYAELINRLPGTWPEAKQFMVEEINSPNILLPPINSSNISFILAIFLLDLLLSAKKR
mgnify:CR=1 FL=1